MTNPSRILIDGSKFGLDFLKIYWYGALIVLGIIIALALCSYEAKRRKYHKDCVIDLCLIIVPLGTIFARIFYIIFKLDSFVRPGYTFWQVFVAMINVRDGGLAIYGAIIGGVLGMVIYSLWKKMHLLSITDLIMPTVALAQAIGRWGNFFNQEAYGKVIADGFPAYFPLAVKIDECRQACCTAPANLGNIHYATFFYESVWCLIIFIVLWFIVRKKSKRRGDLTFGYLAMYGFERAFVEGLRTDSLMIGSMRVSQLISIVLCAGALAFFIVRAIIEKKKGSILMPAEEVYYSGKAAAENKKEKDDGWEDVSSDDNGEEAPEEKDETDSPAEDEEAPGQEPAPDEEPEAVPEESAEEAPVSETEREAETGEEEE